MNQISWDFYDQKGKPIKCAHGSNECCFVRPHTTCVNSCGAQEEPGSWKVESWLTGGGRVEGIYKSQCEILPQDRATRGQFPTACIRPDPPLSGSPVSKSGPGSYKDLGSFAE